MQDAIESLKQRFEGVKSDFPTVDYWRNQTNTEADDYAIVTPAVFFSLRAAFDKAKTRRLEKGGYLQQGTLTIEVRLVQSRLLDDAYALADRVYRLLQDYTASGLKKLERVSFEQNTNEQFYSEIIQVFECVYFDYGVPDSQVVTEKVEADIEIE